MVAGWDKEFPALTMAELQTKRAEFWDTRIGGRAECWQALRTAIESGDESTQAAILESAEMTPFDIERAEWCFSYDTKGYKYEVPLFTMYVPSNLKKDAPPPKPAAQPAASQTLH